MRFGIGAFAVQMPTVAVVWHSPKLHAPLFTLLPLLTTTTTTSDLARCTDNLPQKSKFPSFHCGGAGAAGGPLLLSAIQHHLQWPFHLNELPINPSRFGVQSGLHLLPSGKEQVESDICQMYTVCFPFPLLLRHSEPLPRPSCHSRIMRLVQAVLFIRELCN